MDESYLRLQIEISSNNHADCYLVSAKSSIGGEYSGEFQIPDSTYDIRTVLDGHRRNDLAAVVQFNDDLRAIGQSIFNALFYNELLQAYDACIDKLQNGHDKRLVIAIQLRDPQLATVPWELMYDKDDRFIATTFNISIVR